MDVGQLVEALASSDPAAATEAVAGLRDALMKNAAIDDVRAFVQRLMMAAERDVEAASILLREIITESFGINREARVAILRRSEEHTSELQSLMRISSAVFCFKKKKKNKTNHHIDKQRTTI